MSNTVHTQETKKAIINRWFGSNESANRIAEDLKIPVGDVLQVIQHSRTKKVAAPQITDDKIPFAPAKKVERA